MFKNKLIKLFLIGAACLLSAQTFAAKVDANAPSFSLLNTKGEQVSLKDFAGKHVILEWTNHLCPYVKKHYGAGNMQRLQEKYTKQDVVWLSIISSAPGKQGYVSAQEADELSANRNVAASHVLFDPEGTVGKMFKAKTTPQMYLIDEDGILRYNGAIDSIKSANPADIPKADSYVDINMDRLLAGEQANPKKTVPYGCSIKYKS